MHFLQSFVATCQAVKTSRPGESAFDHPAARQDYKALVGLRESDHFEFKAVDSEILKPGKNSFSDWRLGTGL
jgi:hypothetical protein